MRYLFATGLSLLLLFSSMHRSVAFMFFELSQSKLAAEKCEMRSVKGNTCQGACVLRELLHPTPQEDKMPFSELKVKFDELFTSASFEFQAYSIAGFKAKWKSFYLFYRNASLVFKVWHPPKLGLLTEII